MQVKASIFDGPANALGRAADEFVPESTEEFAEQVEALASVLQTVSTAVANLRERGQLELPVDRSVLEHLARVVEQLDAAVAVAAEGGPLLGQLRAEQARRNRDWLRRGGEAA